MPRANCLKCEEELERKLTCSQCRKDLPPSDFPRNRRYLASRVCITCKPASPGRVATRKLRPYTKYWCEGCSRSLAPDWFDIKTMRGEKWVIGNCRSCKRDEDARRRLGKDDEERKLRHDVLYDFDLARNMFGMAYGEAVVWLVRGYGHLGVDEPKLRSWGMTETRREIWNPDECN